MMYVLASPTWTLHNKLTEESKYKFLSSGVMAGPLRVTNKCFIQNFNSMCNTVFNYSFCIDVFVV